MHDSAFLTTTAAVRATLALEAGAVVVDLPADRTAIEIVAATDVPRLVVASIDASDCAGVAGRLAEIEADPSLTVGVLAQRLVRRLCGACATPQPVGDLPEAQQSLLSGMQAGALRQAVGCARCRGSGYAGRIAVTEVAQPAHAGSVATLWDSGLRHVLDGTTTLGELLDAVSPPRDRVSAAVQQDDIDALLSQLLGPPPSR